MTRREVEAVTTCWVCDPASVLLHECGMEVHMPGRSSKSQEKGKSTGKQERGSEKKNAGSNRKSSR